MAYLSWSTLVAGWLALAGCASSEKARASNATVCEIDSTWMVGNEGGVFSSRSDAAPAKGTVVNFPRGTFPKPTRVTLSFCSRDVSIEAGRGSGVFVKIDAENMAQFGAGVAIELQYSPQGDGLVIPYRVADDGKLHLAQLDRLDRTHGRLTIWTLVPGTYTWIVP